MLIVTLKNLKLYTEFICYFIDINIILYNLF